MGNTQNVLESQVSWGKKSPNLSMHDVDAPTLAHLKLPMT